MREYSDYIEATRNYLKRYSQFKVTVENLNDDIDAMQQAIEHDVAAPISKYGDEPGSGTPELNTVEASADRHSAILERIEKSKTSIANITRILRKVDRALAELKEDERFLIKGHFIEHRSWRELSSEKYLSEKWAREKSRKAIKEMAFMIFGERSLPEQQNLFVFYE